MKIYAVKISDINEEKLDKLCLSIDSEKRHRIERFINKKDKIRASIGEILVRSIIIRELNIENEHIKFEENLLYGKPYLHGYLDFNFNISHSEDFVVCAVDSKPVGIDIEAVKCIEYKDIAQNFFTEREFNYIVKQKSDIQLSRFYEIWTLKESYMKCIGKGFSIPLKSFSVCMDEYESIRVIDDNQNENYIFKIFDISMDYKMAVCSLNREISDNIIVIDQNSLINNYFDLFQGDEVYNGNQ